MEREHRVGETARRVVDVGHVTPEGDGWSIDGLTGERGGDAF
jgi:hypothetical protein